MELSGTELGNNLFFCVSGSSSAIVTYIHVVHPIRGDWPLADLWLMVLSTHVMSDTPLEVRILIRFDDGEDGSGGFRYIAGGGRSLVIGVV